jgi:tetratricopeptide (TPR) repeat protein
MPKSKVGPLVKNVFRYLVVYALLLGVCFGGCQNVWGAPKKPSPSPAASGGASASPAALPTATPEPADIAIPRLEAKIKADPNDKDSLLELVGYYLAADKNDQALALTQRLLSLGSKNAQVYYLDGVANQGLGRVKEATTDFEQATALDPTNAQILLTLTNLYLQTNRAADAERVAKRATTFNASDKRVWENYGLVLGQEGKFDDARTQFEAAAKLDPKDPQPIVLEARSYVSQRALALAGQDFDRALAIDPKSSEALLGKASLQSANHNVKDAIATYEQLFAVETTDDEKAAVILQEYTLYRDEKMNDDALAQLKRALAAYPNISAVHLAYGDYYFQVAKDTGSAEAEWKTALGPNRDNPQALDRLGEFELSRNKPADALGYFKRLAEVVPGDPGVLLKLGEVQSINRQYDDARKSYVASFQLQHAPAPLAGIGAADLELHNYKECTQAIGAIDKNAADFIKQNPQLLYVYAKCAVGIKDKTTARSAYTRFKAFVKPGTQLAAEVDKALKELAQSPPPKPAATAKPRS